MIKPLTDKKIDQVVNLHRNELSGFLPELGGEFLTKFYRASLETPDLVTYVEEENGIVRGFVSYSVNTEGLNSRILKKDLLGFVIVLLRYIITHPLKTVKFIKIIAYPGFSSKRAELLSIAVDRNHRMKGIGKKLLKITASDMKKKGIKKFKISVYDRLPANAFYRKTGCKLTESFEFMGELMNYYEYEIRD